MRGALGRFSGFARVLQIPLERGGLLAAASQAPAAPAGGGDPCFSAGPAAPARAYLTSTPASQQAQLASTAAPQQAEGAAPTGSASVLSGQAVRLSVGDPFLNSIDVAEGPLLSYKEGREKGFIRKDPRQEATVEALQRLYDSLLQAFPHPQAVRRRSGLTMLDAADSQQAQERSFSWWSGLFKGSGEDAASQQRSPCVRGLYMYGGVGVGKTMLMDMFAAIAPPQFQLERTHFHDFMIGVHSSLRRQAHVSDPLSHVADEIVGRNRVLCLDEFFVTDVADAMIVHRLFNRLWQRGLVLVSTSNRHPDSLYEGGLQRNLFLPFIATLKERCAVHDMNSTTDYRRLAAHRTGLYFVTPSREEDLYERFIELTNTMPVKKAYVEVAMGRQLELPRTGGCIAHFTFDELCEKPLGAADYIALANAKHTIALAGVPVFTAGNRNAAYRFVTLVDVMYEHRVRMLISAEAMPFELFEHIKSSAESDATRMGGRRDFCRDPDEVVDDNLGFAKDRCISRLTEMQSREYLRAHAKAHAPELLYALEEVPAARAAAPAR